MYISPWHLASDGLTADWYPSWTNPKAKNVGRVILKNTLFTLRTLTFSFFFGTLVDSCLAMWINLHHLVLAKPPVFSGLFDSLPVLLITVSSRFIHVIACQNPGPFLRLYSIPL